MNQADKDAEKWMQMHMRNQQRELIKAKELGTPHYINEFGDVVTKDPIKDTK